MAGGPTPSSLRSDRTGRADGKAPSPASYPASAAAEDCCFHDATLPKATPSEGPRLDLGQTVITPAAASVLQTHEVLAALRRHVIGDWGELGPEDWAANNRALIAGERVLSAYRSRTGIRFWIITEAGREVTTVLLPEDY